MTTTTALIIAALIMLIAAVLFAANRKKASAQADRQARLARQDMLLRYKGGDPACVICGEPTRYTLNGTPVHPGPCRRALEAQPRSGRGAAA